MKSRQSIAPEALHTDLSVELVTEASTSLLKELHLLTAQGQLNADARRKIKQINHLYQLIQPALEDLAARFADFQIVDVGAGKAYLGFIIYQIALHHSGRGRVVSIEERAELVTRAKAMAERMGFSRMEFIQSKIKDAPITSRVNMVTALHACDTATDDALILGLTQNADYIAVVPCCQAEVAQLLKAEKQTEALELWRHGIHRREFGSHFTNVLRALVLESLGYQVTVTELVGWEHSLKNEFIFAKRVQKENRQAAGRLESILKLIPVEPQIVQFYRSHRAQSSVGENS